MEWRRGDYYISTDAARVDRDAVYTYLANSYWAAGIPRDVFERSLDHALCFSLWHEPSASQVGFARVITDRATFGYLGDVYVLEAHRGHGLARWLMQVVAEHPELQGFRRWCLLTRDAHGLYQKFGWTALAAPDRWMERWDPEVYRRR